MSKTKRSTAPRAVDARSAAECIWAAAIYLRDNPMQDTLREMAREALLDAGVGVTEDTTRAVARHLAGLVHSATRELMHSGAQP
jgi:hypothetical protein